MVRLSTTPVWDNGRIAPRPFVLRVFAAATPDGWTIMPGGFCRIADQADARAVSMGEGVRAADVWVVSDKPVRRPRLLPATDKVRIRRIAGKLPSRAADNLFWLGRYLERAEATLRLVRALGIQRDPGKGSPTVPHSVERIQRLLVTWGATSQASRTQPAQGRGRSLAERREIRLGAVAGARGAADRDIAARTAVAGRLAGHHRDGGAPGAEEVDDDDGVVSAAELTLQELASFAGLAQENMNRVAGWRFLEMGRRAERAINTCRFARQFAYDEAGGDDLDVLLTWWIARSPIARAIWSVRCWRRCATWWCWIPTIRARSRSRSSALNDHIASLPTLKEGRIDRGAAASRRRPAGDADDGGGGIARHQDAVCAGAGSAESRRRHRIALFPAWAECEPA